MTDDMFHCDVPTAKADGCLEEREPVAAFELYGDLFPLPTVE